MLGYLQPESSLTLRQAIAQLREEDAKDRDVASRVAAEVERSMTAHDAVHVIFACDTSDRGEAIAHAWMLLGTTVTHRQLRDVIGTRDHAEFVRQIGNIRRLKAAIAAFPDIVGAGLRARRMHRRWSWTDYDRYLDMPLADIRTEYGIAIARRRGG